MPVLDGRDFSVFYTPEPTTFGLNDDDSTYTPLPECESVSGRGVQEDVLEPMRHGKRVRSAALYGKIDHDDLSLTCNLTDDAVAGDVYSTFLKSIFDETYANDALITISYTFLIMNSTDASGDVFEYYHGCVLNEVEFNISEGEIVEVVLTFMVQKVVESATELYVSVSHTYTSYPATVAFLLWSDVVSFAKSGNFTNDDDFFALGIAGDFSFAVNQNGEKLWRLDGQRYPNKYQFGEIEVSGDLVIDYVDLKQKAEIVAGTGGTLTLDLGFTTATTITFTNAFFEGISQDSTPNELMTQEFTFKADTVVFA